ncbi:MAG: DUF362 domain-containing protein [Candidatus Ancaeobacter aquaticus]|nr:DUF362 domain-containing protein [Candidatus Ancaeobacter aquaticus]
MGQSVGGTNSRVSLIKCASYNDDELYFSLKKCLDPIIDHYNAFKEIKGSKILLKVNLLSTSKGPDKPVNTHPSFVKQLARYFIQEHGAQVYVGDSSGSFSQGSTNKAFFNMGLDRIAKEVGFTLINFDTARKKVMCNPDHKIIKEIVVPGELFEMDLVVTVPKLKTHELVGFTGAVKNMMGCLPGKLKRDVHVKAPTSKSMAVALCDIYAMVPTHLAVMDGIIGMEGNGPAAGEPVETGLILASNDPVSLDAVVTHLLGYKEGEIRTTVYAHKRKLGVGDLNEIEIIGDDMNGCYYTEFVKVANKYKFILENIIPSWLISTALEKIISFKPFIDTRQCVRCFECVKGCPVNCIEDIEEKLIIQKKKCIECFCCQEVCPVNAVTVKPPLVKIMLGKVQKMIEYMSG